MGIETIIKMKQDLEIFRQEKNSLLDKYHERINTPEEKVSCYMTAILYEYQMIEAMSHLREAEIDSMHQTEEGRTKLLARFIEKNFDPNQRTQIFDTIKQAGYSEIPSSFAQIAKMLPAMREIAAPTLHKIDSFKQEIQELYLKHHIPLIHISPVDIQDGHINPSVQLENQPQNEILTGVFATSSYSGMNQGIGRVIAGGMNRSYDRLQYPKNPFLPIDEQDNPDRIKLAKQVYAYALNPNGFELQVHFEPSEQGFTIKDSNEWVKKTQTPIAYESKETITEVDSQPFLETDTQYVDAEERKIVSFREAFAQKFQIPIEHHDETSHAYDKDGE